MMMQDMMYRGGMGGLRSLGGMQNQFTRPPFDRRAVLHDPRRPVQLPRPVQGDARPIDQIPTEQNPLRGGPAITNPEATQPNYPMYNQQGTTWQNYRGGMQQPMPYRGGLGGMMGGGMYGGGGMMGGYGGYGGGMMGGYGGYGGGMMGGYGGYGGGMMGGYGGGMMGGLGGMMPPQRPRPSPYGGGLSSGFGRQMFGSNPYGYSQMLGGMGQNFQMNQFPQTDLYNLMAMQQGSFNPYINPPTDGGGDTGGGNTGGDDGVGGPTENLYADGGNDYSSFLDFYNNQGGQGFNLNTMSNQTPQIGGMGQRTYLA